MASIKANDSAVKGHVKVANLADSSQFLLFSITELTVQNTDEWWNITVGIQAYSAASPFTSNENILVSFVTTGDVGDKGAPGEKRRHR